MSDVSIAADIEAWARQEVAAGRGKDVASVVERAVRGYLLATDKFRQSLDRAIAEADRDGWIDGDEFLREVDQWIIDLELQAEAEERGKPAG